MPLMDSSNLNSPDEFNELLRQRVAELAHELSQPLYAIGNFAEACLALLERPGQLKKAELTQLLTQIGQQARRGGDILRRSRHGGEPDVRPDGGGATEDRP
jgi:signal transduction histidine kinase